MQIKLFLTRLFCLGSARRSKSARSLLIVVVAAMLFSSLSPLLSAQATAYPNVPPLLVGAAWYPEQWDEAVWDHDLALMEAGNIHLVRVGEFAWSRMEPSEGQYKFDWLERAVAKAAAHHIVVVMGTPSAAPRPG